MGDGLEGNRARGELMTDLEQMLMQQEGTGPRGPHGEFLPYPDSVGKLTIGYGHLVDNGLPSDVALLLFRADIADAIEDVLYNCSCYHTLSRPRQMVMISLAFNLGRAKLAQFVRFLGAVHLGHWNEAADELLNSKAARQDAPLRYRQLAEMMRGDTSPWV